MRDEALSVDGWHEPHSDSYSLFDDLASGFAVVNAEGHIVYANVAARLFLEGPTRQRFCDALGPLLRRLHRRGGVLEVCVQTPSYGNVRLSAAQSPMKGEVWALFDRDGIEHARTEASLLRELLATATSPEGTEASCRRLLSSMTQKWPGTHWALYLANSSGKLRLVAYAQNPLRPDDFQADADIFGKGSAVATAFHRKRMLHFPEVARAPLSVPCAAENAHETSVLLLPLNVADETLGVLYVGGPKDSFVLPQLRLIQGLAEGLGSLLRHSRLRDAIRSRGSRSAADGCPKRTFGPIGSTGGGGGP